MSLADVAPIAASAAALASWATVWNLRRQWKATHRVHLEVVPSAHQRPEQHPLEDRGLKVRVSNAGPGTAHKPAFAVATGRHWTGGSVNPAQMFMRPGDSFEIRTDLVLGDTPDTPVAATWIDGLGAAHVWAWHGNRRRVLRTRFLHRHAPRPSAKESLAMMYPDLDVAGLEYAHGLFSPDQLTS